MISAGMTPSHAAVEEPPDSSLPSRSPGLLALGKYWGLDSLLKPPANLAPLPPDVHSHPAGSSSQAQQYQRDEEEEQAMQQYIQRVLQRQEQIMTYGTEEDPGYLYFVDVSRDDALRVSTGGTVTVCVCVYPLLLVHYCICDCMCVCVCTPPIGSLLYL